MFPVIHLLDAIISHSVLKAKHREAIYWLPDSESVTVGEARFSHHSVSIVRPAVLLVSLSLCLLP